MSDISLEELRSKALELGWDDMGVTEATIPAEDIAAYEERIAEGFHADLAYMENRMRCDPTALFPGAKSAILFVSNYKQSKVDFAPGKGVVASYARGRDYHNVHRKRLAKFIAWLEERSGEKGIARGFSDSAPVMEKALAVQAGLGWFGKNTLLIHRKFGTFILLSGLFTTLQFPFLRRQQREMRCGTCTRCLDACPVQALTPYKLNAGLCLSYHLIESKKEIPVEIASKNPGYVFGCDICQDVCPHNVRKPNTLRKEFAPESGMGESLHWDDILHMQEHPEVLHGTPLKRRGALRLKYTFDTLPKQE